MRENDLPLGMARLVRNYGAYSVIVAGAVTVWSWAGWGFPFVMAKDYSADKVSVESRLSKIETAVNAVSIGQLEAQELQLIGRLQSLDVEIAKAKPTDPVANILALQRGETDQSLRKVRNQLRAAGVR